MKTKDFPAVIKARKAAEAMLSYYRLMMKLSK